MTETYKIISVKGGKFHRPKITTRERGDWFVEMPTVCGSTVKALNVFEDMEGVYKYNENPSRYLCLKCFPNK